MSDGPHISRKHTYERSHGDHMSHGYHGLNIPCSSNDKCLSILIHAGVDYPRLLHHFFCEPLAIRTDWLQSQSICGPWGQGREANRFPIPFIKCSNEQHWVHGSILYFPSIGLWHFLATIYLWLAIFSTLFTNPAAISADYRNGQSGQL